MAANPPEILRLAEETIQTVTANAQQYMDFLATVGNNYKYSYLEQVLIHAQKPGARACAELVTWNKLGRWVNKHTPGIALLVDSGAEFKLRYVFDIEDTNSFYGNYVNLWGMEAKDELPLMNWLEDYYGAKNSQRQFPAIISELSGIVAEESYSEYMPDLYAVMDSSLLEGLDENSVAVWFKKLLRNSVGYSVLSRCGYDASAYYSLDDFSHIRDFSTCETASVLGTAVSNVSEMLLRDIANELSIIRRREKNTVRTFANSELQQYNGDTDKERSHEHEDRIQDSGGLPDTPSKNTGEDGAGNVRTEAEELPANSEAGPVHGVAGVREAGEPLAGDRPERSDDAGEADEPDAESSGSDRGAESPESDGVAGADEQPSQRSRGDSDAGAGDELSSELPTVEQQQEIIQEAELEKSSAFAITQEEIDAILVGSGNNYRIYEHFLKMLSVTENAKFLKNYYGVSGSYPAYSSGGREISKDCSPKGMSLGLLHTDIKLHLSWEKVARRIWDLVIEQRYISPENIKGFSEYKRKEAARIERTQYMKEFAAITSEFNDLMEAANTPEKRLNRYYLSDCESTFIMGERTTIARTIKGDFIMPMMTAALESIIAENTPLTERSQTLLIILSSVTYRELWPSDAELNPPPPMEYRFSLGDTVHIGAQEYELLVISDEAVRLFDPSFPLLDKEMTRAEFDEKIAENPLNNKYLHIIDQAEPEAQTAEEAPFEPVDEEEPAPEPIEEAETELAEPEAAGAELPPPAPIPEEKAKPSILHPETSSADRINYRIRNDDLGVGTPGQRYQNNVRAIRLLKKLESQGRLATAEEQEILAQYVGWGGLADCFDEKHSKYLELKALLSDEEYAAARESTLTAFYTPPVVIKAMYGALENMGFKTGNVLEPSCGIGNFMGLLPKTMEESKLYGVELDSISARIAQQLYQKNSIAIRGFEKTDLPDSFFDCAIGNVPFGQFKLSDRRYDKHNFLIHDYFFAKALDKLRPGGIMAFISSKGTMDKENPGVRKYLAQRAELLGAIRLPNNTFKSAAGTEVTSDILFFQKRESMTNVEPAWVHLGLDENGLKMNQYFIDNPQMVLGEMKEVSGPYGPETACLAFDGQDLEMDLSRAVSRIQGQIWERSEEAAVEEKESIAIPADPNVRNFSYTLNEDELYFRENSLMQPVSVSATAEKRIRAMIGLRDCVRKLIEYQTEDYPDSYISSEQQRLNQLYDEFSKRYGRINSRANSSAFSADSGYFLLASLEILDDEGNFVRKADMFSKRTINRKVHISSVDTASEALALSLAEKARIDMPYMMELCSKTEAEIFQDLKGVIFLNPMFGYGSESEAKYLTADEYLSGNVREKLAWAKKSAELFPEDYAVNVEALEQVQPVELTASEISVRLGATWLPPDVVQQFMYELLDTPRYAQWNVKVHFSQYTGEWNVEGKSYDRGNVKANSTYGTDRINAYKIIEDTLNLRDVRIYDYVLDETGRKTAVLNHKETAIAQGKQEQIKSAFADWIWKEPRRRERLCKLYNEKFNSNRPREYDGSHINFVGMNPEITLRTHQVNAIARILYGGNTLLAHVVGAGKTFEMVAAAQESKRLGLCQKSLFVVPNHLTEQWASEYLQLYPSANILVATNKDFETANRKKFCSRIATGDYDAVIIGHSQFEKIPMSIQRQQTILEQQIYEITEGIQALKRQQGDNFSIKQMERSKKTVKQKLEKLNDQSRKDDVVTFEELGVDRLFVDEAHYYKNLAAFTKMRNVGGISQTEAQKSSDLYMKCRYLDEITGGKGIIFATGTPISNSMVELYTMQKYLQYDTLRRNGLIHFDAWASTFGETVTAIELAPEGTGYRAKTRFAKFYNLPELMVMFKEVADIQTAETLKLPVPEAEYHNVVLKPSEHQKNLVAELSKRAERVRNKMVDSSEDNMLLITNDGRKLALDQRLMNELMPDSDTGKTRACADAVYDIWERNRGSRATQMVFCDLSTPHGDGKFNVYDDMRDKLIAKGIPKEEIAYIHSAGTEAKKKELFGKVRSGQIRILLGSTQKMGAGTNVQKRLLALHHLDCPWRPSDLQQREGRIIRQGNDNSKVDIFTYVTEDTFDSYLYQLVESKQKFIGQIMTSKSPVRSAEDIDETALSYAELKALCAGNPLIKEKMDLDIAVQRLKLLKASHLSQRYALEDRIIKSFPKQIAELEQRIDAYYADMQILEENTHPNDDGFSPMLLKGMEYDNKKEAGAALLTACKEMTSPDAVPLGQYRGFPMELSYEPMRREYVVTFKGSLSHSTSLGTDITGNFQRIEHLLSGFQEKQNVCKELLENVKAQLENAKLEVQQPFPQENDLQSKSARLDELNILLNMDKRENEIVDGEPNDPAPQSSERRDRGDCR